MIYGILMLAIGCTFVCVVACIVAGKSDKMNDVGSHSGWCEEKEIDETIKTLNCLKKNVNNKYLKSDLQHEIRDRRNLGQPTAALVEVFLEMENGNRNDRTAVD